MNVSSRVSTPKLPADRQGLPPIPVILLHGILSQAHMQVVQCCAANSGQLCGENWSVGHAGRRMLVWDGDVSVGREAAKYVHSLRWRGVSRAGAFYASSECDGWRIASDHHNLWGCSHYAAIRYGWQRDQSNGRLLFSLVGT